jgi:CMP-N-acetylneuraminic acid synthetase
METKKNKKCIILARGGSKRITNKNSQLINGKSLVEYAIDCCIESGIDTILSSDSEDILEFGKKSSIKLHKRAFENSDDKASSESALLEVLRYFNLADEMEIILVPPTNPTRTASDLLHFIDIWEQQAKPFGYDQGFSVLPMKNDFWYQEKEKFFRVRDKIFDQIEPRRSDQRLNIFLETSALYICRAELIYAGFSLVGSNPYPIEISKNSSFDIDDESDLEYVRKFLEK